MAKLGFHKKCLLLGRPDKLNTFTIMKLYLDSWKMKSIYVQYLSTLVKVIDLYYLDEIDIFINWLQNTWVS